MKKILMTMFAAIVAVGVNAQVYVGGGVGFSTVDNGDNDYSSFKFLPEVGYSFNDEWAAGVVLGWEGVNKGGKKTWSFNPYARYTFLKGKMVDAFLDGSIGYAHSYNAGLDVDALSVGIKPGIAVRLNNRLSAVTHIGFIGYNHIKNNKSDQKTDEWGVDFDGNNIVIGLYYNF